MGQVIFEWNAGTYNTPISTSFKQFDLKMKGSFPTAPYRVTKAQIYFSRFLVDSSYRILQVYSNAAGFNKDLLVTQPLRNYGMEAEKYYSYTWDLGTDSNWPLLTHINLRSQKGSASADGSVINVRSSSTIQITITYEITTSACTPLTALNVNATMSEGNVTLTGSGAGDGTGNTITGYELQYRDSVDGNAWGGWNGYTTLGSTIGSFSAAVPPPARGYYRQWRARTVGTAGAGYASDWKEATNKTQRYALSTLQLNKASVEAGGAVTAQIFPMANNLTHRVTWKFGTREEKNAKALGVLTDAYTIPLPWLDQIPAAASGSAACILETLLDGTALGSVSAGFVITCPANIVPAIESLTAVSLSERVPSDWNLYLKGLSKVKVTMTGAVAGQGSTIVSYSIVGGGATGTGTELTTGLINQSGNIKFTATVIDARGRAASKEISVLFTDYEPPKVTELTAFRADSQGSETTEGTRIKGHVNYVYAKVGENAAKIDIAVNGAAIATGVTLDAQSNTYPIDLPGPYDITKSYKLQVTIRDTVNAVAATAEVNVNSAARIININESDGLSIAFGKMAEKKNAIEFADNLDVFAKGKKLEDLIAFAVAAAVPQIAEQAKVDTLQAIYSIGSEYRSYTDARNPVEILGFGTWVPIIGRVTVGVDPNDADFNAPEKTGGSKKHKHTVDNHSHTAAHVHTTAAVALTVQQMPSHTHTFAGGKIYVLDEEWGSGNFLKLSTGGPKGWATSTAPNAATGSGAAHSHGNTGTAAPGDTGNAAPNTNEVSVMPPYITCYMWKRIS